jgi:hypothetical protein
MEILGELTALVGSLSVPGNVYTRSGAVPVGLPDEVYALALEAQRNGPTKLSRAPSGRPRRRWRQRSAQWTLDTLLS